MAGRLRAVARERIRQATGFVKTDLHGVDAPMSPAQGAVTSVQLATLPNDGPNGAFFHADAALAW